MFCTAAHNFQATNESRFYRDFSKFNKDLFLKETSEIDFASLIGENVNQSMNAFAETLQLISDKHAPVRKLSNRTQKQSRKPWITPAILKSIKKRQKLFSTHFLSNDPNKVSEYKKYNNKLNKIKEASKTNYFKTQFEMYSDNLKTTWKLIGTIINRKKAKGVFQFKNFYIKGSVIAAKKVFAFHSTAGSSFPVTWKPKLDSFLLVFFVFFSVLMPLFPTLINMVISLELTNLIFVGFSSVQKSSLHSLE